MLYVCIMKTFTKYIRQRIIDIHWHHDNIQKFTVHYRYFLGGTSNNIILDLHKEGKASHKNDIIGRRVEQLAGDIAALNSTTTCEAKHIYCVDRDEGPEAELAGSLQR